MEELRFEPQREELDRRDIAELDSAFAVADNIVTKRYLARLEKMEIASPPSRLMQKPVYQSARLFKVARLVYDKEENNLQKLMNIYASAAGFHSNIAMVLDSDGVTADIYLGTCGAKEMSKVYPGTAALYNNFVGNFPGSLKEYEEIELDNQELEGLIERCLGDGSEAIASVSGVASGRSEEDAENAVYIQGLEKLIDTMEGKAFTAIFIADAIGKDQLDDIKAEYELLYSKLVPFLKSDLSFNDSFSDGISRTLTKSLSSTLTSSNSTALSIGTTESTSHTQGESVTHTGTVGIGIGSHGGGGENKNMLGKLSGAGLNYSHSIARGKSWSDTTSFAKSNTQTKTFGEATAKGETEGTADGSTKNYTSGRSLQITYQNKTIEQLLARIDEQLKRITESENYGVFAAAAYFIAQDSMVANMAASSYKSLISGANTHVESAEINSWQDESQVRQIKEYLRKLRHPDFRFNANNLVSPATMVSSRELAIEFGLPKKSVNGIPVLETASFGRNIEQGRRRGRTIRLGCLYHMGRDIVGPNGTLEVGLNVRSLAMHTFITGSTGAGKSNAVYSILERLMEVPKETGEGCVKFMVIEPAKGEYKNKFGNYKNVSVYGTNGKKMPLLRLNPFSFPEDIHVLEHIDRLTEIFNVCWPMYAAMPAVLKDAIERAYVSAGWDLTASETKYRSPDGDRLFPCFKDVLSQINAVIEESKYSSDSKGDYAGALCTRVRSLTNGLYSQIFTPDEIAPPKLFDENVIVDLSRTGSVETKALIMGLLVMKMQEYRMSSRYKSNAGLQHVTVLEEAHNLLKRTSTEQSSDTSNMLGKSVEMLANAIAEMRTYGEGFIIADQSPGLMDMSVIRNTNTKIILRLPDISDRELVGRAATLKDNQIMELAQLRTGVAAIYQNDWLEPVLCHIDRCRDDETDYQYQAKDQEAGDVRKHIIDYLLLPVPKKLGVPLQFVKQLEQEVFRTQLASDTKADILDYIKGRQVEELQKMRGRIIYNIFNSEAAWEMSNAQRSRIDSWYQAMLKRLEPSLKDMGEAEQSKILALIANEKVEHDQSKESVDLFNHLMKYIEAKIR